MRSGRRSPVLVLVAGLTVALVWTAPGAGATKATTTTTPKTGKAAPPPKPTGNAATIAFYRKVVAASAATDGVEQIYPAQAPLTQVEYSKKGLSWATESPKKAGFTPANDVVFVGASRGKVTFVADSVVYPGKGVSFPSFGVVLTAKGEVVLAGGAPAREAPATKKTQVYPCAGPYKGPHFVAGYPKVGVPFGYSLYGHFDPLKKVDKGKAYQVTSTYPWLVKPARKATEVDIVPVGTYLPSEGVIHVSAVGKYPAFTLEWANVWFKKPLYPPVTNGACAAYLKGVR